MVNCKYSDRCGGCVGIQMPYENTLSEKQKYMEKTFSDFGNVHTIISNYYPYKYRNKLQLAFSQLKGKTIIGFFEEGSTKITDIDGCILNGDWSYTLISILREYISRFKVRGVVYGEGGVLRYAHARCIQNKLQLTLCVTTDNFPGRDWLYKKLAENFDEVSFYLNINKRTDHAVFDNNFRFVAGNKYLMANAFGVNISIEPSSFLQVNEKIATKMYKHAVDLLQLNSNTTVLDLYCGIGITSILFSKHCQDVIAIEENPKAISNAIHMAKINNANNIKFLSGKCENNLDKMISAEDLVVFVDPARLGLDSSVIERIKALNPRKIVYMSCNPETCVRDLKLLVSDNKYSVSDIFPYDMFAYTKHIETLVCLQRQVWRCRFVIALSVREEHILVGIKGDMFAYTKHIELKITKEQNEYERKRNV